MKSSVCVGVFKVYELGWNWDEFMLLAQGSLAGHLLECGCQLTGGYFMHPGSKVERLIVSYLKGQMYFFFSQCWKVEMQT